MVFFRKFSGEIFSKPEKLIYKLRIVCYNTNMAQTKQKKKFYMHKISHLIDVQKIVTIHYQALEKNYLFPEESHDFWEINYADKENVFIGIDGEKIELKQGEMLFIKPNQPHFMESGNKEPNVFIISFSCRSESINFFGGKTYAVPENYRYLLQNIMAEAENTFDLPDFDPNLNELKLKANANLGGEQMIKNTLETLLIYMLRSAQKHSTSQQFFVSKIADSSELQDEIVRILNSKIYGKFSLADLSNQLHYGTTRLCTFSVKKREKAFTKPI